MNPPEIVDQWLARAAQRDDAHPLDVRHVHQLSWCIGSAALPGGLDEPAASTSEVVRQAMTSQMSADDTINAAQQMAGLTAQQRDFVLQALSQKDSYRAPSGSVGPVQLAYLPDRSLQLIYRDAHGPVVPVETLCTAEIDLLWSDPPLYEVGGRLRCPQGSALHVGQYQADPFGVLPPQSNGWLLAQATLAARWVRAKSVIPTSIDVGRHGVDVREGPLVDEHSIRSNELQLRELVAQVEFQRHLLDLGEPIRLRGGRYCTTCGAAWYCPVINAQLKLVIDEIPTYVEDPLEAHEAAKLVVAYELCRKLTSRARFALTKFVDKHGPIELEDGLWGRTEQLGRSIQPIVGYEQLKDMVGAQIASEALQLTSDGVRQALREAKKAGQDWPNLKNATAQFYERLRTAGGLKPYTVVKYQRIRDFDEALQREADFQTSTEAPTEARDSQEADPQGAQAPQPDEQGRSS